MLDYLEVGLVPIQSCRVKAQAHLVAKLAIGKFPPPFARITLARLYQNQPHRLMKGCVCLGCTEVKSHATGEGQLTRN